MTKPELIGLLTGSVRPLGARGAPSGIHKTPVAGPLEIGRNGLAGDAQGDTVHHGGPEKAVHHYPFEHYRRWGKAIGPHPLLGQSGAFGENLSTTGLTEESVAIGDVFRLGRAVLEVSQGRQPCWKLNERFGRADMARQVQASGMTGWYYRVREPGTVAPGDTLRLVERSAPAWTLARVWRVFYVNVLDLDELAQLAELPSISPGWRQRALARLQARTVEDWSARLDGPPYAARASSRPADGQGDPRPG